LRRRKLVEIDQRETAHDTLIGPAEAKSREIMVEAAEAAAKAR
jgi:hypothetical protein